MTYKKFELFLPVGENFNLEKSIRLFNRFLEGLTDNNIEFPNFNHYPDKGYHITFRAEMDAEAFTTASSIAETLETESEIQRYVSGERTPPPHVKTAHKLASQCAIEVQKNQLIFDQETQKPIHFLMYFVKLCLEKIGYDKFNILEFESRFLGEENPHRLNIETIVNLCEEYLNSNKANFQNPDFIERFIHLFMNCTLMQMIPMVKEYDELVDGKKIKRKFLVPFEDEFWKHFCKANSLKRISENIKTDE